MKKSKLSAYVDGMAARAVARRRLPLWLGLLMPLIGITCWFGSAMMLVSAGVSLRGALVSDAPILPSEASVTLMMLGAFISALVPALMMGNILLWLIPPIRTILDRNATGAGGTSLRNAMRGLAKVACFTVPIGGLVFILGMTRP